MRTLFLSLALTGLAAIAAAPAATAAPNDASVARALVGSWVTSQRVQDVTITYHLTLTAAGEYVMISRMVGTPYQVSSGGRWAYQDGWLTFQVAWSEPRDPNNRPLGLPPARILEIGPDFVRTPEGIARRVV
jgi:hypothetical protein